MKYQPKKRIEANKVTAIDSSNDSEFTPLSLENGHIAYVNKRFMQVQRPIVGGYYVVQHDGYRMFLSELELNERYSPCTD